MVEMVLIADGKYGHPTLKRAWDIFTRECKNRGWVVPRIMQARGYAAASANTHSDGLAVDWDKTDTKYALLWRQITSGPAWPRLWAGNFHTHGLMPNSTAAAYQVRAYKARRDGLGWQGMQGKDTLAYYPPMSVEAALSRWEDGKMPVDGKLGPVTVRHLQTFLNGRRTSPVAVDGDWGTVTTKALGEYLATNGKMDAGAVTNGRAVVKAWQDWRGVKPVDGYMGPQSTKVLQTWLNSWLVNQAK